MFGLFYQAERLDAVADEAELIGQDGQLASDGLQLILGCVGRLLQTRLFNQQLPLLGLERFLPSGQLAQFGIDRCLSLGLVSWIFMMRRMARINGFRHLLDRLSVTDCAASSSDHAP